MNIGKSKTLPALFTIILSILLILSTIYQNQENACISTTNQLRDTREMSIYYNILQSDALFMMLKDVEFLEDKQQNLLYSKTDIGNVTKSYLNSSIQGQQEILKLNQEINEKRNECNNYSIIANIFLYLALITNTIALFFAIIFYKLYKE